MQCFTYLASFTAQFRLKSYYYFIELHTITLHMPLFFLFGLQLELILLAVEDSITKQLLYLIFTIFRQSSFFTLLNTLKFFFILIRQSCLFIFIIFWLQLFISIVLVIFVSCTIFPCYAIVLASITLAAGSCELNIMQFFSFVFRVIFISDAIFFLPRAFSQLHIS